MAMMYPSKLNGNPPTTWSNSALLFESKMQTEIATYLIKFNVVGIAQSFEIVRE